MPYRQASTKAGCQRGSGGEMDAERTMRKWCKRGVQHFSGTVPPCKLFGSGPEPSRCGEEGSHVRSAGENRAPHRRRQSLCLKGARLRHLLRANYYSALVEEQETAGRKRSHAANSDNALMFGRIAAPTQPQETCRSRRHRQDQNAWPSPELSGAGFAERRGSTDLIAKTN